MGILVALDALLVFLPYLLVTLLGRLLDYPVLLDWAHNKLHQIRCLSFSMDSRTVLMGISASDDGQLISASDLEIVMERMGSSSIRGSSCVNELGSWLYWRGRAAPKEAAAVAAVDELIMCAMFEEQEPSLEEVMEAFCVFDHDGDGFISAEELQRVLSILGLDGSGRMAPTVDECRRMIGAYDENRDGRIDPHEFVKLMERSFF